MITHLARPIATRRDGDLVRCDAPRRQDPCLPCNTVLAQLDGDRLSIRCKNCRADHDFVVRDGRLYAVVGDE